MKRTETHEPRGPLLRIELLTGLFFTPIHLICLSSACTAAIKNSHGQESLKIHYIEFDIAVPFCKMYIEYKMSKIKKEAL